MPRGKEQNEQMRAETLKKIVSAALKEFAEYGYHGATMRRIAKATGLSYGIVYHYFPSKEKIFCHLLNFALYGSLEGMRHFMGLPGTAWQKIQAYSAMIIKELFEGETSYYFIIVLQAMTQGKAIPGLLEHVGDVIKSYYDIFIPVIENAQKSGEVMPGDPAVLAATYFSFVNGLSTLVFQGNGIGEKITPDLLTNVLCNRKRFE